MDSANYYTEKQNFESALKWAKLALPQAEKEFGKLDTNYASSLSITVDIFYNLGILDSAVHYQETHLSLSRTIFKSDHPLLATSINNMAYFYDATGNYSNAEPLYKEALEIRRRLFTGDHAELAESINNMAHFYDGKGKYNEAEPLYKEALEMTRRLFKEDHPYLARSINSMAMFYNNRGKFAEAEPLLIEALEMRRRLFNGDHPDLARSINNMALFFERRGRYAEAERLFKEALEMKRRLFKGDHPDLAQSISNMAIFYHGTGRYAEAEPLFKEGLEMRRRLFNGDHPDLAMSIDNLAVFYQELGRYVEAEHLYTESLEMLRHIYKSDQPALAQCINNNGMFYNEIGRYAVAESLLKEALDMRRRLFKVDHPDLAESINNMSYFYYGRGKYDQVEPLLKEVLEMYRRMFKSGNKELATYINNIATFYARMGRYTEAEPLFKEALEMYRNLLKDDDPNLASIINSMAYFYDTMGRFAEAEPLFKNGLEMYRRIFKSDHRDLAMSINNMAYFLNRCGRYAEAEPLFKEALEMNKRIFKSDNPGLASNYMNMAYFYDARGKYAEAEQLFKEALEMRRRLFKGDHPDLAMSINGMANFYYGRGKYKETEALFKEALEMRRRLFKGDHPELAEGLNNMAYFYEGRGRYTEAESLFKEGLLMYRRIFNDEHPNLALSLNCLALFYIGRYRYDEAEPLYLEALQVYKKVLANYFPSLSENEKMLFWSTMSSYFEAFNSFILNREKENPGITRNMYENQLLTKGLLLNSTIKVKDRIINSGNKGLIKNYEDLQFEKNKIAKFQTQSLQELAKKGINLDSVINDANNREKELSRLSEDFKKEYDKKEIKWEDVRKSLGENESAIEIVRFRYFDKRWTDTVYYAALIIKPVGAIHELPLQMVLLKNGVDLEGKYIRGYRDLTNLQRKRIFDKDALDVGLKNLYTQFWAPIQEKLKGIKTVYLSLDGVYNLLNLNTLINPETGKYILEELDLRLLTSTRDLVERNPLNPPLKKGGISNTAELFGDPEFDLDSTKYVQLASNIKSGITRDYYYLGNALDSSTRGAISPLPGTRKEIENIASSFQKQGWKVNRHLGLEALEEALKAVNNPRALHIATHGKFLKDVERRNEERMLGFETQRFVENPLLRSMLLFSGAENTLLNQGQQSATKREDGLLTAYEAQNLNLDNTELVVLSACETGLGEVKNGEGVYGLQRAFQVAGAKSLIMSLWSVSDQATQELMSSFYNKWLSGKTKREAFREAQMELKKKYPGFYFWGAFVMVGE